MSVAVLCSTNTNCQCASGCAMRSLLVDVKVSVVSIAASNLYGFGNRFDVVRPRGCSQTTVLFACINSVY